MHELQLIQDIGLLNKGLELLRIEFAPHPRGKQDIGLLCHCLRHADGSLSALWPAAFEYPPLLRFLPLLTRAERKRANRIRLAIQLKMPVLAGIEELTLYASPQVLRRLWHFPEWLILVASPGRDRRMLAWHRDLSGKSGVTKLSLSIPAAKGIYRERVALQQVLPEGMLIPGALAQKGYAYTQEDLQEVQELPVPRQLSELPAQVFREWLSGDLKTKPLGETRWFRDTQYWLLGQQHNMLHDKSEIIQQKIRLLFDCMAPEAPVPVSRAHGDFTPRHLRLLGEKLLVTGWRLSEEEFPALFDWFHFLYYSRCILDEKPFAALRKEIDDILSEPEWEAFLLEHDIDAGEAEQQYLLCAISRFLQHSDTQDASSQKLLLIWCEALGFWMDFEGILNHRQIVLQDIMHFLHELPYAALGLADPDITMLPLSERLELLLNARNAEALHRFLKKHRGVLRIQAYRIAQGWRYSVFLYGGGALHLDCLTRLRQGSLVFGDLAQLLELSYFNEAGVQVLPQFLEQQFYQLRLALQQEGQDKPFAAQRTRHGFELPGYEALFPLPDQGQDIRESLRREPENSGLRAWSNRLHAALESLLRLAPLRGFVITFSGVDEAGQRTVIEATRHRIRQELQAPVLVLPHRPGLARLRALARSNRAWALPQEEATDQRHPAKPSFFQWLLRPAEDLYVQLYIRFRYVLRGYIVLYDQYFECAEQEHNKVKLPHILTHWWHRFLLKPKLNILLYAPAELVRQRSQELHTEDIERITGEYLALFQKLGQRSGQGDFISVRNTRLGDTLETLFRAIHRHPPK